MLRQYPKVQLGPKRPSEFRRTVEERTDDEPLVEYNTEPDQPYDRPEDYEAPFVEHGETAHTAATPVYQVSPPPAAIDWTDWTAATLGVGPNATQIGDASRRRQRFVVRNLDDANDVYLARLRTDTVMAAYTLPAGQDVEFHHNGPIAVWADGDGTPITYFAEHDVDDPD